MVLLNKSHLSFQEMTVLESTVSDVAEIPRGFLSIVFLLLGIGFGAVI